MTALALRHVPLGEVIQLLTWHVASARDLPGVLAWRLGQVLTAARRDQSRSREMGELTHASNPDNDARSYA